MDQYPKLKLQQKKKKEHSWLKIYDSVLSFVKQFVFKGLPAWLKIEESIALLISKALSSAYLEMM